MEKKIVPASYTGEKIYIKDLNMGQILVERGYGEKNKGKIELLPYEALYLIAEGWLELISEKNNRKINFEKLLNLYRKKDRTIWARYLVYRDLRERGYVVKAGFGLGVDFRVYERGMFGKEAAKYLVYSVFEGEPVPLKNLVEALSCAQNSKKEMILGVIERRGEVVYYSLSQFNL
jgi:tRNA-intron endonuclease